MHVTGSPFYVTMNAIQDRKGNLWFGTQGGVSMYDTISKQFTIYRDSEGLSNNNVWTILEDKSGTLWFGSYGGGVSKFEPATSEHSAFITHYTEAEGLPSNFVRTIFEDSEGAFWFGTNVNGLTKFDGKSFTNYTEKEGLANNNVRSVNEDNRGNLFVGTKKGMSYFVFEKGGKTPGLKIINILKDDGLKGTDFYQNASFIDSKNRFWSGTNKGLEVLDLNLFETSDIIPNIVLNELEINSEFLDYRNLNDSAKQEVKFDSVASFENYPLNLILPFDRNHLTFHFSAIDWSAAHKVKYQFKIDGLDSDWAPATDKSEADYRNIPYGTYSFKVRAIGESQKWSDPLTYTFTISPPWYHTVWFRSLLVVLFICLLYFLYRSRTAALRARQKQLENTVEERTEELKREKEIVEEKHKEITDSINYAERIQRSFLATKELLKDNLKDYFVFFQPKDVVSGDFYWASKLSNDNFVFVTADSTGHGVPGAIMSILNISCLEKSVDDEKIVEPSEILNHTRLNIIKRLKKDGSYDGGKDGMDCSVICFDFKNTKLTFAAANNPIWIVRKNELLEFKADKMPVGKHDKDFVPFTQQEVHLQKGDVVYALTDGMPDQFGGPRGKKFMHKQLKELLVSISNEPMELQKQRLSEALNNWKGSLEQIDDVCIVGIRI